MAFIRAAIKLILRERRVYDYKAPVLCLGVPEIYATFAEFEGWCRAVGGRSCAISGGDARVTEHRVGRRLGWIDAGTFFKALGLDEVVTVDLPGAERAPDIFHDLNEPFPTSMHRRFNLVFDPGSTEHVFDVKTCFTNIVRALAVDGTAIHQVPIYSYNGGYFSMNPILLHDFYRANGFADIRSYIVMWDRYYPYARTSRVYPYDEVVLSARHALADRDQVRYSPHLVTFVRKVEERDTIVSPLQFEGHYEPGGPGRIETTWSRLSAASKAVDQSRWHVLRALKIRLGRRARLWRIRRRSFWL